MTGLGVHEIQNRTSRSSLGSSGHPDHVVASDISSNFSSVPVVDFMAGDSQVGVDDVGDDTYDRADGATFFHGADSAQFSHVGHDDFGDHTYDCEDGAAFFHGGVDNFSDDTCDSADGATFFQTGVDDVATFSQVGVDDVVGDGTYERADGASFSQVGVDVFVDVTYVLMGASLAAKQPRPPLGCRFRFRGFPYSRLRCGRFLLLMVLIQLFRRRRVLNFSYYLIFISTASGASDLRIVPYALHSASVMFTILRPHTILWGLRLLTSFSRPSRGGSSCVMVVFGFPSCILQAAPVLNFLRGYQHTRSALITFPDGAPAGVDPVFFPSGPAASRVFPFSSASSSSSSSSFPVLLNPEFSSSISVAEKTADIYLPPSSSSTASSLVVGAGGS